MTGYESRRFFLFTSCRNFRGTAAIGSRFVGLGFFGGITVECPLDTRRKLEIIDLFSRGWVNYHTVRWVLMRDSDLNLEEVKQAF